jgi:hypothetical protein
MSLPVVVVVVDGYEFGTSQAWSLWRQDVSIIKSDLYRRKEIGKINDTRNLFDKMPRGNLVSSRVISIHARN